SGFGFSVQKNTNQKTSLNKIKLEINKIQKKHPTKQVLIIANKVDLATADTKTKVRETFKNKSFLFISAKNKTGIDKLTTT
ncbi:MAG: hypothetical protein ACWA42_11250, partial [Lutibacter sp.]